MRPNPLCGEPFADDPRYVRDRESGVAWHRSTYRVLYVDTDRSGAVYHANYLRFFEVGRTSLLRDAEFPYSEVEASGFVYPIVKVELTYHRPLAYDETMWIHTRFRDHDVVRVAFDYVITSSGSSEVACRGFTIHCATNGRGQPVRIDPMTLKAIERFPT